jgi:hypothetical protein
VPGTLSFAAIHDAGVVLSRFSFGCSAPSRNSTGGRRRFFRQFNALLELAIFTIPVNIVPWLPLHREKATFIPVGANCPGSRHHETILVWQRLSRI